jgi:hypothetical protein
VSALPNIARRQVRILVLPFLFLFSLTRVLDTLTFSITD